MVNTIDFNGTLYPKFQTEGFAARFAFPFAQQVCKGEGYDIGCMKPEWALVGSTPIDLSFDDGYHATNLPKQNVDYIFSSHCLEHIVDWVGTMDYWYETLKPSGTLFLYLPDYSQEYWRPWNNRKHVNIFTPSIMCDYLTHKGYKNIFVSGIDLNNAFMVMCEK
jgi:predicted SAM-dependent methyltransferase